MWKYTKSLLQVYVGMLIVVLLAGAIVGLKIYLVQQLGPPPNSA
jgi:hypothetical protein